MSEVGRLLSTISSCLKGGLISQVDHDRLLTLASNKNPKTLPLLDFIDDPEQFARAAIAVVAEADEEEKKSSGRSERKPRALNINVVKEANVSQQAIEQDEEQTESDMALREKRLNGSKRRTMPEKLQIDPSKLNAEAKAARN